MNHRIKYKNTNPLLSDSFRVYSLFILLLSISVSFYTSADADQQLDPAVSPIEALLNADPDKAIKLIDQQIADKQFDGDWALARLLADKANALVSLGRGEEALALTDQSLKLLPQNPAEQESNPLDAELLKLFSDLYSSRSGAYYYLNDFNASESAAKESLRLARLSKDPEYIAYSQINMADVLDSIGQHETALSFLTSAFEVAKSLAINDLNGLLHTTMGNIYVSLEKDELAIDYYQKALAAYGDEDKFAEIILSYNIANAYYQIDQSDRALSYLDRVIELSLQLNDQSSLTYAYFTASEIYAERKQWQRAIDGYKKSSMIADEIKDYNLLFGINISLAEVYSELAYFEQANELLAQAKQLMGDEPATTQQRDWNFVMAKYHAKQQQYSQAYQHLLNYSDLDHQYFKETTKNNLTLLRKNLETQSVELEKIRLEKEYALQKLELIQTKSERQKYWYLLLFISLVLIFTFILFYRQHKVKFALARLATLDDLTRLHNRRATNEYLQQELERFQRYKTPFCVALFDIDHFKKFNDNHGHIFGDKVLVKLSRTLSKLLRANDKLSRWGGEEFLLILPEVKLAEAVAMGQRLLDASRQLKLADLADHQQITFSMGVVEASARYQNVEAMVHQADTVLYQAKSNGRNRIESAAS